jgi:2,4-dienoyl-CoA reductase-like NADH-dependent reductase (Old Yellow Enzyme family)
MKSLFETTRIGNMELANRFVRSGTWTGDAAQSGTADYICLSRPLIREPDLVLRWKAGDRRQSACRSDTLCGFQAFKDGRGVSACMSRGRPRKRQRKALSRRRNVRRPGGTL